MAEWIEYETICVTRADWESFATRFANSRHPDERSLYKYVHGEVLPRVVEAINEEESRLAMERAMTNRKRSSRIALRESEREERERIESEARAKIARERAEQAAAQEKAEREAAEYNAKHTRELRLREREERLREREERLRARRGSPMAIEHGENAENEKQEAQVSAYPPDHVSASAPAPAPAPPALPTNPPHFSSAVLPVNPSSPDNQGSATPPSNTPAPIAKPPVHLSPPAPVPPASAQPALVTSPRKMPPTGSFPIRTHIAPSPLSRVCEPSDEPSEFSLGGPDS